MQKIDILIHKRKGPSSSGETVAWRHKSESGVESGSIFRCFYRDKPPTVDEKIKAVKQGALEFMGLSEDQVKFEISYT